MTLARLLTAMDAGPQALGVVLSDPLIAQPHTVAMVAEELLERADELDPVAQVRLGSCITAWPHRWLGSLRMRVTAGGAGQNFAAELLDQTGAGLAYAQEEGGGGQTGRKLSETDPNGKVWTWTWNVHNQLTSSQTPTQIAAGQSTTYAYGVKGATGETQGQLKQRSVPGAQTAVYTRDALGLVTKAETKNGANQTVVAYDYAYDPAKRLNTVTDSRGNKTLTYTWTPGGRLASVEDSDGHQASFAYDATGRLASVVAPNGETIAFTYDAGGRLVEQRLNSGQRTTQSWFEDGSLKQKQNLFNATTLSNHVYTIDNQGRRSGQTETIGGTAKTWSYAYDNLDRLTEANDGTAETYGYDIYGNRRSKTKTAITTAYLYDNAHQLSEIRSGSDTGTLTGAAVHDADGHMTKLCEGATVTKTATDCTATGTGASTLALVWNALEHLNTATRTGVGAVAESYQYDDSGRRIRKTSGSITTSYLYNDDDIHAEWSGSTISGMPSAVYAHGANIDEPLLRLTGTTNSPAATQAAYIQDGLGSVIGTANTTGTLTANQRFDAWGNKTASTGTTPTYGYTGREPDATGLTYFRARYQHPGLGRFVSRDPMGMADAVSGYAYVGNNPINLIDPLGLYAMPSSSFGSSGGAGGGKGPTLAIGNLTFMDFSAPTQQTIGSFGGNPFGGSTGESILLAGGGSTRTGLPPSPVRAVETLRIEQLNQQIRAVDPNFKYSTIGTSGGSRAGEVQYLEGVLRQSQQSARGGTYMLLDPSTSQVMRTGRTNDLGRREGEHRRDPALGQFEFRVDARSNNPDAVRGREQFIHEFFNPPLNRINPINPKNPNRPRYMEQGELLK